MFLSGFESGKSIYIALQISCDRGAYASGQEPDQGAGQGASVQGAGLPIHGCRVQNHWVSPRTTPIFILLRSIKMGTKIFWQLSDKK